MPAVTVPVAAATVRTRAAADGRAQLGVQQILDGVAAGPQRDNLLLRAQCFYFSRHSGVPINPDAYAAYLGRAPLSPLSSTPNPVATTAAADAVPIDTTQNSLTLDASVPQEHESAAVRGRSPTGEDGSTPYPKSFAEIVELITSGKPIPGIKEIPNELSDEPPSESVEPQRRKPWEQGPQANGGLADGAGGTVRPVEGVGSNGL